MMWLAYWLNVKQYWGNVHYRIRHQVLSLLILHIYTCSSFTQNNIYSSNLLQSSRHHPRANECARDSGHWKTPLQSARCPPDAAGRSLDTARSARRLASGPLNTVSGLLDAARGGSAGSTLNAARSPLRSVRNPLDAAPGPSSRCSAASSLPCVWTIHLHFTALEQLNKTSNESLIDSYACWHWAEANEENSSNCISFQYWWSSYIP